MKKLFLLLAAFPALIHADLGSGWVQSTNPAGVLFKVGDSTPVTYTPKTTIPQGSVIKKIIIYPNAVAAAVTITVWDAPSGLTYSSLARIVVPTLYSLNPGVTAATPYVIDFTDNGSPDTIGSGVKFKYFPIVATSGTVSPTVQAIYKFTGTNPRQP